MSAFGKKLTVTTLYKLNDNEYFISVSSPTVIPGSRYSTEYLSITKENGMYHVSVNTDDNYLYSVESYEKDDRIYLHDYKTFRHLNSNTSLIKFQDSVKGLIEEDRVVALIYLWYNFFVCEFEVPFNIEEFLGSHPEEYFDKYDVEHYIGIFFKHTLFH